MDNQSKVSMKPIKMGRKVCTSTYCDAVTNEGKNIASFSKGKMKTLHMTKFNSFLEGDRAPVKS